MASSYSDRKAAAVAAATTAGKRQLYTAKQVAEMEFCAFPGGYSPSATKGDCVFDLNTAIKAVNFGPSFFAHVKGEKGGQPFSIERWQAEWLATLFGWKKPDGLRRYRMSYLEVPRGNGKSSLCMVVVGLLMYLDDEPGADIFSAAGTRDQAKEVFTPYKTNVLTTPALKRISEAYQNAVVRLNPATGLPCATYKAIAADADFQHGGNPHGIIFDELHVQPNRELWDVLQTGTGKRRQPLTVAITTAGYDRQSICYEQHSYAEKVRDGIIDDVEFLPVIYAASETDDWTSPETWRKANPNIDVSIMQSYLAKECKRAQDVPAFENTFKRLHLNIWTEAETRAIQMEKWDACCSDAKSPSQWRDDALARLAHRTCYGGLDVATRVDIAAFVLVFEGDNDDVEVLPWFWCPAEAVTRRAREPQNTGRYQQWAAEGFITLIEGERIDQGVILEDILKLRDKFQITEIAYDPWNAEKLRQELEAEGIEMVEFAQGMRNFNEPTKDILGLILSGKLRHGHNPVLRWMASNLATKDDASGNMRPDKKASGEKIDGIVAMIMARAVQMLSMSSAGNYYEDNEVEFV